MTVGVDNTVPIYYAVGSITLVDSQQIEYFEILIKF